MFPDIPLPGPFYRASTINTSKTLFERLMAVFPVAEAINCCAVFPPPLLLYKDTPPLFRVNVNMGITLLDYFITTYILALLQAYS